MKNADKPINPSTSIKISDTEFFEYNLPNQERQYSGLTKREHYAGLAMQGLLANITQEEINKYFPPDTRPKGWLSIEEYLPMMCAIDIVQGYTLYKVKDKNGNEFESAVSDHNNWYYYAKEEGITHWWNGE